tara:strand:- start:75 stop:653 length:579 start_codon:yes stop_codon:yes gene_type:complete
MNNNIKKNVYFHEINTTKLVIPNINNNDFQKKLEEIPYLLYEVEEINDGRKIVINKPGGKNVFGSVKREDIMVFIYLPTDKSLWLISHKDIKNDLKEKFKESKEQSKAYVDILKKVFNGTEPSDLSNDIKKLNFQNSENPDVIIKALKWIWGQEDCNYPPQTIRKSGPDKGKNYEGRKMSFKYIQEVVSDYQ